MAKIKKIKMPDNRILDIVDAGAVRFNESQSLTTSQQSVGRANIGAGTVSTKDETPSSSPVSINADTLGGNAPAYYATDSDLSSLSSTVTTLQTTKADVTNGTVISDNADFAEIGEWHDGNPGNENRLGYFVTLTTTVEGFVIDKATTSSDVCGVIVEAPAFSGNADGKYNADGTLKKQYDYVALIGLVSVVDNGTCTVPGKCMPASDGTAIPSTNNMGFNVITRLDSTHIEVFVRPAADMLKRIKDDVVALQTGKVDKVTGKGLSTNDYTTQEKTKLAGIAENANNYELPTASSSTLGGIKVGTNLSISEGVLSATDTKYSVATTSTDGLMSASDKTKLNGIEDNANNYVLPVASSSLGGVKSGTDITVDTSGNVSVNDDSHNHIISNVDGLQTALDNKANASEAGYSLGVSGTSVSLKNKAGTVLSTITTQDTDTKNTAGATDTSSKIYLVGATSQDANPQTYSDNEVYATSGALTTKSVSIGGGSCTLQYSDEAIKFVFA